MSRIDDLIAELCPEGIAYATLAVLEGQGYVQLGRGEVISKTDLAADPGDFPVYSSSGVGNGEFGRYGKYMFDDERLTWSVDGGGRFFYRQPHQYSVTNVCGWLKVLPGAPVSTRFLYYALTVLWTKEQFNYTRKAHPSVIRDLYRLPIPPLEVQQEIVRILDNFTELESELESELEARRKQYAYYRDRLLTFPAEEVRRVPMGDIATIGTGSHDTKDAIADGEYEFYARGREPLRLGSFEFDEQAIITAGDGVGVGKVFHFADGKYALHQRAYRIVPGAELNARYLFHYLVTDFSRYLE